MGLGGMGCIGNDRISYREGQNPKKFHKSPHYVFWVTKRVFSHCSDIRGRHAPYRSTNVAYDGLRIVYLLIYIALT